MPRIMSHHEREEWRPLLAWPDDCGVQWGGSGLVLSEEGSYGTAFFEAFPGDGVAGFIRGEGKTVEEAEADAFARFERQRGCFEKGGHAWTRSRRLKGFEARERKGRKVPKVDTYTNGGCFCLRCGAFQTVLQEIPKLGKWREPLSYGEFDAVMSGMIRPDPRMERAEPERRRRSSRVWRRRLYLRARMFGIEVPDHALPEFALPERHNPFRDDAYKKACREAVVRYYVANREAARAEGKDWSMEGLFDGITRRRLEEAAARHLAGEEIGEDD